MSTYSSVTEVYYPCVNAHKGCTARFKHENSKPRLKHNQECTEICSRTGGVPKNPGIGVGTYNRKKRKNDDISSSSHESIDLNQSHQTINTTKSDIIVSSQPPIIPTATTTTTSTSTITTPIRRDFPKSQLGEFCFLVQSRLQRLQKLKESLNTIEQVNVDNWISEMDNSHINFCLPS